MKFLLLLLFFLTIELFPQSWQVVGDMPNSVAGGQAVVKGNMIYILGGFSDKENTVVNLIQAYDPQTGNWSIVGQMQYPRTEFVADVFSDSVIYFGGLKSLLPIVFAPGSIEVWNFKSPPYMYKSDTSFARSYATSQAVNGNLYTFGGITPNSNSDYLFGYNIDSDKTIGTNDSITTPHFSFDQMSAVVGTDIYIFGGTSNLAPLRSILDFNITTNTLSEIHAELEDSRAGGAAVSSGDSVIYLIGGYSQTTPTALKSVSMINLKKREIEEEKAPSLNFPRKNPVAVNFNGSIYVFGGVDQAGQPVTQVERLDLVTGISNQNNSTPQNFELENNYPNPFNPSTQIAFKISKTTKVSLDVYSILGTHVKNIVSRIFSPGEYNFTWNGTDNAGNYLASGIYIYTLSSDYFTNSKKMVLLK